MGSRRRSRRCPTPGRTGRPSRRRCRRPGLDASILTSSSFEDGGDIPQKHGKKVASVSPQLSWAGSPGGTRSFALSVVDRHPVAGNYLHWLAWVTQQARNLAIAGSLGDKSILLRDRDAKFPASFDEVFRTEKLEFVRTPVRGGDVRRRGSSAEMFLGDLSMGTSGARHDLVSTSWSGRPRS